MSDNGPFGISQKTGMLVASPSMSGTIPATTTATGENENSMPIRLTPNNARD